MVAIGLVYDRDRDRWRTHAMSKGDVQRIRAASKTAKARLGDRQYRQ
jgi:hypothetical protein